MSTYKAKKGTAFSDEDAAVIGRFLEKHFPNGEYDKKKIVELASKPRSPIHKYFEWDDTKAAEKYRITQAGRMSKCLVVVVKDKPIPAAVSVRVRKGGPKAYVSIAKAVQSDELMDQVLEDAISALKGWEFRFRTLKGASKLKKIFTEINKL